MRCWIMEIKINEMNKKVTKNRSIVEVMEQHELSRVATLLFELCHNEIITPTQKGEIIRYIEKNLDFEALLGAEKHNPKKPSIASSQIEISDDEIEKEAEKITNIGNRRKYWKDGIKWYREQMKSR